MKSRWIIPILVLPGNALVIIPGLIIWFTRNTKWRVDFASLDSPQFWIAVVLACPGLALGLAAMAMFFRSGNGTPAPWDPPAKLVVRGPYRWVRNPMLSGLIMLLFALALGLRSWPVGIWATVFFIGNAVYFPLSEEPNLRKRFGKDYEAYCKNVPRWIPRIRPWSWPKS